MRTVYPFSKEPTVKYILILMLLTALFSMSACDEAVGVPRRITPVEAEKLGFTSLEEAQAWENDRAAAVAKAFDEGVTSAQTMANGIYPGAGVIVGIFGTIAGFWRRYKTAVNGLSAAQGAIREIEADGATPTAVAMTRSETAGRAVRRALAAA